MKRDNWLSKLIGKDVYNWESNDYGKLSGKGLFCSKVDINNDPNLWYEMGFNHITTEITFERMPVVYPVILPTEDPLPEYHEQILALAETGFSQDRFHKDPDMPFQIANKIKKEWIRSYLNNKRGESLLVSVSHDGRVRGFLAPMIKDSFAIIDLIAVHEDFRKQGIGEGLVRTFMTRYYNHKYRVGTQLENIASIRMYEKCGFRMVSAKYVFHKHMGG